MKLNRELSATTSASRLINVMQHMQCCILTVDQWSHCIRYQDVPRGPHIGQTVLATIDSCHFPKQNICMVISSRQTQCWHFLHVKVHFLSARFFNTKFFWFRKRTLVTAIRKHVLKCTLHQQDTSTVKLFSHFPHSTLLNRPSVRAPLRKLSDCKS
mmetsp:Transcript_1934/g.2318  ORF Transcript_1934/g.2318 Transcript_1934/m.2318 type:complete len:156 (-) Transcript_1934:166-633(-)